jgi:hypothetical protein
MLKTNAFDLTSFDDNGAAPIFAAAPITAVFAGPAVGVGSAVSVLSSPSQPQAQSGDPEQVIVSSTTGFSINLKYDAAALAPGAASFRAGIQQAANLLAAAITDKITVNLIIHYSGTGGGAFAGPDNRVFDTYSQVRAFLVNNATPGDHTFDALPGGSSIQGQTQVAVFNAQEKLFGQLSANDTTTDDGSATFATDINPNLLVGVALHELTHALGRVPSGPQPDIFDLFRFTSPGNRFFDGYIPPPNAAGPPAGASFFSLDGGNTKLADYGEWSDPSDFLNPAGSTNLPSPHSNLTPNDPFNEQYGPNTLQQLTAVDLKQLDALGFHLSVSDTTAPVFVNDNPLSVVVGGTGTITSSLLSVNDPDNTHAQLTYTVVTGPSAGTLLKNGSATSSFTQDDIDNNRITFHDDGRIVSSDSFTFNVSDPAGNHTANTQFQFQISHPDVLISALANLSGYSTLGTGDFNHDGFSDIVLQNNASGKMEIWYMGNGQIIGDYPYGNLSGYNLLGTGDFNGDGTSDIVWQAKSSGQTEIWYMSDGKVVGDTPYGNLSGYNLIGTGDFNHSGSSDIVWQNKSSGQMEIWYMSGGKVVGDVQYGNLSSYNLIGTADLNHDGNTDLIWQNKTTGKVDVWFMANGKIIADYDYGNLSAYKLLATGDINHDGTNDLLWQNKTTGEVSDWIIGPQTGVPSSFQSFGIQPLNFHETGSGFNQDGSPDVLWQDPATGQTQIWNVNHHDLVV